MRLLKSLVPLLVLPVLILALIVSSRLTVHAATVPHYDHIFVIMEENHNYNSIIGKSDAPTFNQLAQTYGLATSYTGVGDPSEPNYVGLLSGNTWGIADDNPYYTHTVNQPSIADQLEGAKLTWKGYFETMPYPGYMGVCYPAKCGGIPDTDALYAAKHNGFPNFTHIQQSTTEQQKMVPITQLNQDLASGQVPNFGLIVPDECHDMHGSPPSCFDSGPNNSTTNTELTTLGDSYLNTLVTAITGSAMWSQGENAIVVTFDEGNSSKDNIATVVITNHGPRGVKDNTSYNHYSLLLSMEQAFGLGCLQNSCTAQPMTPLFTHP